MIYDFKCHKCNKVKSFNIPVKEYDKFIKTNPLCEKCNEKMSRIYSNVCIKTNDGYKK